MSLSGSVIVLLYMLSYPIAKQYFPVKWRCFVLRASLFFYLVPIYEIKYYMMWGIDSIFRTNLCGKAHQTIHVYDKNNTIFFDRNVHYGHFVVLSGVLLLCLGCISFFIISRQLLLYKKVKKIYSEHAEPSVPPEWRKLFDYLKKDLGVTRHVDLKCAKNCKIPIVMGVLHSTVFLPAGWDGMMEEDLKENILRHELIHVRHHDILVKFLGLFVIAVHWFNPVSYFLYREICILSEISCDEEVVRNHDDHMRIGYSHMILNLSCQNTFTNKERLSIGLVNSDLLSLKRRILEMKNINKGNVVLAGITFSFICMAGITTSFAYEPPEELVVDEYDEGTDYFYIPKQLVEPDLGSLPFDDFWVDVDGVMHEIPVSDERKACHHIYENNGELGHHKKIPEGSCSIAYREALSCTLCGDTKDGCVLRTINYPACDHE